MLMHQQIRHLIRKSKHIFLSFLIDILLVQSSQLVLIYFSFKNLSNELFYSVGLIQIIMSFGLIYFDGGIYTIIKSKRYKQIKLRNYLLSYCLYRFIFFSFVFAAFILVNEHFKWVGFNEYFFVLVPYLILVFIVGFFTTIIESDGRMARLTYMRSVFTAITSGGFTLVIYYFKYDYFYIFALYIIQVLILIYILIFLQFDFNIQKFRIQMLFSSPRKMNYSKNSLLTSFFVENYFVFLSYLLGGSSGQTVVFYKIDKYLKLFYSFLVGFYQRTLFYIQMQNELSISSKNLMVGFICVSCFGVIPLYFLLSSMDFFKFEIFLKLSIFYSIIYGIVLLTYSNVLKSSKRTMYLLNGLIILVLLFYTLLSF